MSEAISSEVGQFGRIAVLLAERRLLVDGQPVALGSRAFDLLAALVSRRDRVVPKDELIDVVWPGLVVEDNNLQVQISALRKALGAQAIATVAGRGYQFTVAPAAPAPAAAAPPAAKAPRSPQRGAAETGAHRASRLLVADDNKVNRLLLCRSLALMGHDVASADNGRIALEMLRGENFDMLLLDLEMPELDGFSLLEQRAREPALQEVPVIVTSSLEGAAQIARCIELGADDYLHKPVNPVLLKARVDSSLERKRLRDRQHELLARMARGRPDADLAGGGAAGAQRVEATLLVAGLHGIDALAQSTPPHETIELLSSWATLMVDAIDERGGLVHTMAGDGLAAAFGVRAPVRVEGGAAWAAVQAAREMGELLAQFNAERAAGGKAPIEMHIGIAGGEVVAGDAGTPQRAALVCIGAAAQRAARLEALAAERAAPALLDGPTQAAVSSLVETDVSPSCVLPGHATPAHVFALMPR